MTEVPINIQEYRIISCLDAKNPSDAVSLKRTLNLKEHLKKDKIELGLTSVLKQELVCIRRAKFSPKPGHKTCMCHNTHNYTQLK